ncbi:uncharacterized protein LOC123512200 [Portunus trituberculatus]|uniref:uncharacterized protein LOC123499640 n=1 Tax=Portunus trituberculatus TaxID=210409 RepID=UPI001E1CE31C|nr:uncharacterized protein LOC123499640 [Portunus trituberculatus]XP_045104255.1 uncharacterized protein LOC123499819 [Portunus trituberculatus]XP_045104975.1 uncharacterized protein LOC123500336 [Portunus trituberculatus]XP_045124378.1 uncharacterized protein LOC123512200 [Portunus trituberculatus]
MLKNTRLLLFQGVYLLLLPLSPLLMPSLLRHSALPRKLLLLLLLFRRLERATSVEVGDTFGLFALLVNLSVDNVARRDTSPKSACREMVGNQEGSPLLLLLRRWLRNHSPNAVITVLIVLQMTLQYWLLLVLLDVPPFLKSFNGHSLPSWLTSPGPVLLRKFVRTSKSDPLVEEVDLESATPHYAHIRYPDGRQSTVSTKDLAPTPRDPNPVHVPCSRRPPELPVHVPVTPLLMSVLPIKTLGGSTTLRLITRSLRASQMTVQLKLFCHPHLLESNL